MTVVSREAVRQAVGELARDDTEEITSHDVADTLDRSPLQWVHSSIGNQLSRLEREGVVEKVIDGHTNSDQTTYRIVDPDASTEPEAVADGSGNADGAAVLSSAARMTAVVDLVEGPAADAAIAAETPHSKGEIRQALAALCNRGLAERDGERYALTDAGEDVVETHADAIARNVGREVVADGGHDLSALADAIERVLTADNPGDTSWTAGPYVAHQRVLSRNGVTIRQVVIKYDGAQSWLVLPEGLAEVVIETIRNRDGDELEAVTDGGIDTTGRDRIHAEKGGEEIEIFNHVSVSRHFYVNSVNGYDEFGADIAAGDMGDGPAPDYVTERLAQVLYAELSVDCWDRDDIEVVDLNASNVTVEGGQR